MADSKGYLPTLDGWRAVAVLLVILHHDYLFAYGPISNSWFQAHGMVGVDIFFGISGLLICSRLLEEESIFGSISLKGFYTRRFFRIFPPAFLYLFVLAILGTLSVLPVLPKEWFASLFFYRNYSRFSTIPGHIDFFTAHFWSLAVEEHFYLLLPGVLVLTPKRHRVLALGFLITAVVAWRAYRMQTRPWSFLINHTDTRLDALLVPALFAILMTSSKAREPLRKLARFWFIPAAIIFCILTFNWFPYFFPLILALLIPLMLMGTLLHPGGIFAGILESAPFRWVGRISYSLYLWQEMFFVGHNLPGYQPLGWIQSFPFCWLFLIACGVGSYYLLERPMIRLGHHLAPPATQGRPDAAPS